LHLTQARVHSSQIRPVILIDARPLPLHRAIVPS
jgi:hypothetical protein